MKKNILMVLVLLLGCIASTQTALNQLLSRYNSHRMPYISVEELKMLQQDNDIVLLDAREPEEFQGNHIKGVAFQVIPMSGIFTVVYLNVKKQGFHRV